MRGLFESTVSQALAKMGESLAARNAPEIVLHAHSITNSAVVVGATALAGLARAIETKAMTGNIEGIEKQYRLMLTFNLAEIQISVPVIPGL
jgi:HPt (histidine-containing phosphotransfer) domain-containing protein